MSFFCAPFLNVDPFICENKLGFSVIVVEVLFPLCGGELTHISNKQIFIVAIAELFQINLSVVVLQNISEQDDPLPAIFRLCPAPSRRSPILTQERHLVWQV